MEDDILFLRRESRLNTTEWYKIQRGKKSSVHGGKITVGAEMNQIQEQEYNLSRKSPLRERRALSGLVLEAS